MAEICRYALLQSFATHRQALTRFLTRRLGNPALAADIAHETWLRVARNPGGAPAGNPRSHLFRIASNLAIDHQRQTHEVTEWAAPEDATSGAQYRNVPSNVVLHRSEFARMARVIDGLPPPCREVLRLCRFEGLSHADIAERLAISRSTVVSRMVDAMVAVEREMDAHR